MQDFLIEAVAKTLVSVTVWLPFAYASLYAARWLGIFKDVGWPDPTNAQMFLIAIGIALFGR